jgi:hypothetical protein
LVTDLGARSSPAAAKRCAEGAGLAGAPKSVTSSKRSQIFSTHALLRLFEHLENVSGAEGSIGVGRVAHARPDGYTIAIGFLGTHVLNGAFYSLQYDVLNDFEPISPLTTTPFILFARKTIRCCSADGR